MRDLPKCLEWLAKCEPTKYLYLDANETGMLLENSTREFWILPKDSSVPPECGQCVARSEVINFEDGAETDFAASTDDCHSIAASMDCVLHTDAMFNGSNVAFYGEWDTIEDSGTYTEHSYVPYSDYPAAQLYAIQQTLCDAIIDKHGEPK